MFGKAGIVTSVVALSTVVGMGTAAAGTNPAYYDELKAIKAKYEEEQ